MRFMARSRVDLPQPEGPIRAVTPFSTTGRVTEYSAWFLP